MQFARVNDITLHYQHISAPEDCPTVVFSNSLATDFRIWRDVIVRLVGQAEIITYDNRGHGLSDIGILLTSLMSWLVIWPVCWIIWAKRRSSSAACPLVA